MNKKVSKKSVGTKRKKRKLKIFPVILLILIIIAIIILAINITNIKITNIYISGNNYLTDQEIIELAKIENYPSTIKNSSKTIQTRLKENIYIKNAKVRKELIAKVIIDIEENRPLFYDESRKKTVLIDKNTTDDKFDIPSLINYVPDTIYNNFIDKMALIDIEILNRMSEIKYVPNDVDDSRFLITMNDGNSVYLTLNKFSNINDYIDIIKKFKNKKGILYLDDGEYFEVK